MTLRRSLVALAFVAGAGTAQAQTLREVLGNYQIPASRGGPADLDRTITSYAVESARDLFIIGFHVPGANAQLGDTLRVSVWGPAARQWWHAALPRDQVGSVLAIHHSARHVYLDTHSNPSAGTLIVLTRRLEPVTRLDGWLLRLLPTGVAVYHKNQVHFAPTHSAELWVYHAASGQDVLLYPRKPFDAVRRGYIDTTRAIYARVGEDWFRTRNYPMDPERFDSGLRDTLLTDSAGRSVVFVVRFGDVRNSPADTPVKDVVVTCRRIGSAGGRCRETELDALMRLHPGWTRLQLLNDQVGNPRVREPEAIRSAVTLEGLVQSRARFRTRPDAPWRYGMLNLTRVPAGCFKVLQFVPTRTLSGEVLLDSIQRLETSSVGRMVARDDWTDTLTRPGENWTPVAAEVIAAAVLRCRGR
jgi:hypothetical protein